MFQVLFVHLQSLLDKQGSLDSLDIGHLVREGRIQEEALPLSKASHHLLGVQHQKDVLIVVKPAIRAQGVPEEFRMKILINLIVHCK